MGIPLASRRPCGCLLVGRPSREVPQRKRELACEGREGGAPSGRRLHRPALCRKALKAAYLTCGGCLSSWTRVAAPCLPGHRASGDEPDPPLSGRKGGTGFDTTPGNDTAQIIQIEEQASQIISPLGQNNNNSEVLRFPSCVEARFMRPGQPRPHGQYA